MRGSVNLTKKEAGQLYYIDKETAMWQRELYKIQNRSYINSPQVTGMPFVGGTSDKTAANAINVVDLEKKIIENEAKASKLREEILLFIAELDDACDRMIVVQRAMCKKSWNEVASIIGGNNTENSVRMRFDRLFEKK